MKAPRHHACLDVMQSERMLRSGCMCTARVLATVRKGEIATAGVAEEGAARSLPERTIESLLGEWCRRAVGCSVTVTRSSALRGPSNFKFRYCQYLALRPPRLNINT